MLPLPRTQDEDIDTFSPIIAEGDDLHQAATRHQTAKRIVDLLLACFLSLLVAPFVFACAGLIRITSRGPAFYSQTRLGLLGQPFRIWKLRTMTHDCEKTSGARWAMRNDPRVTPIGKFLRISHLDELPQLWNVLKGEMSLVGPRPERPEFIPILEKSIPNYRQRMLVLPGVTGLAQVYLPPDTGIPSVRKKLVYDVHYIRVMGMWLDLRLMVATVLQAIGFPNWLMRRVFSLPMARTIEQVLPVPKLARAAEVREPSESIAFESQPEPTV